MPYALAIAATLPAWRDAGYNRKMRAPHLLGEFGDPVPAGRHIGTAGITGHHVDAGEVAGSLWVVEKLREGRNV